MKYHVSHIAPLRAAFIIAVLYGVIPSLFNFIALTMITWMPHLGSSPNHSFVAMLFWTPAIHAGVGFAFGLIGSVIYNLVAKWFGGLMLDIEDIPADRP